MNKVKISEFDTPTHKRIGGPLDEWFDSHDLSKEMGLKQCEDLLTRLSLIVPDEAVRLTAHDSFRVALSAAHMLAQRDEEAAELVEIVTSCMAMGAAYLINEVACRQIDAEQRNNILVKNSGKPPAKQEAIRRARLYIEKDTGKRLRATKLADMVYRDMVGTEHQDFLPDTVATVCTWFREEGNFPEYIHARGRPKKGQ